MPVIRNNLNSGSAIALATTTWTYTLSFTPTAGRCLLMYISSDTALSITSIVQGGSSASWSSITSSIVANRNIYIYALPNIPSGSNTTITLTLSASATLFTTFIEEVSNLVASAGSLLDKTSTASGTGSTYQTGTTATTTTANEYWVNIYAWYDNSFFGNPIGTNPTNGYTIASPNPVTNSDGGWVGAGGIAPFSVASGQIMAYKIVTATGTAGGNVDDGNLGSIQYNGLAFTLVGTPDAAVAARRRVTSTFM